ncbi:MULTISPECIES: group II intron reverse transcriptase/maturase [Oceanobacillus]|uniref:group II intron reverse transcriptase/maturase n=3 Tax=Bacillaceae TaxID=186817 RepID=UPI0006212D91|nr:DNA polymerase [Bacilli bacterium VT-13-104]PZD81352.1 group II intron reverse transcriptase/maturase [Bacilli bacterium]KKE80479.1 DNA polymerase [Bacilli bacterium VT-13-104]PZD83067.1 group II intron reverse transcriptase/maturase [Bacilli bacterium]PZD84348.1 group II intron reverse transcriptase/maturase [Bacilli bacterium]
MLERILSRENLIQALTRVEGNKGSHGVDEMPVQNLRAHILEHWTTIRGQLEKGTYYPQPVRRVEIPKPNGGKRKLGIPTVMDRFLQQAIAQVLTDIYDPTFSQHSYGFRPKRRGHDAVREARNYIKQGYRWVVDMDLEKFFDKVNHDRLMRTLSQRINDSRVLKLIRRYLQAGVMEDGIVRPNTEGAPQGGPLSPLLSNIVLDELDKELEKRGLHFVRYADDCNIYVRSKRAGLRVMKSITKFIEGKLKLKVNEQKSAVDRPWKRKFLGFSFTVHKEKPKIRVSKESVQRFKQRIRELTSRRKSMNMKDRIEKLNRYLVGWLGYYQLADTPSIFKGLDSWIRRRLRMIRWKEWKKVKTKYKNLMKQGINKGKAWEWANTRKAYWRIANSPILHKALGDRYWSNQGLKSLYYRYQTLRWT